MNSQAVEATEFRDSGNPRIRHNAPMTDDLRTRRLAAFNEAFAELQRSGQIATLHDWCKKAGSGWSTVNDFLIGKTQAMSDRTYAKLAEAVGWPVERLKEPSEPAQPGRVADNRISAVTTRLTSDQKAAVADMLEKMFPPGQ